MNTIYRMRCILFPSPGVRVCPVLGFVFFMRLVTIRSFTGLVRLATVGYLSLFHLRTFLS